MINLKNILKQYLVQRRASLITKGYNNKITSLQPKLPDFLSKEEEQIYIQYWSKIVNHKIKSDWLRFYSNSLGYTDSKLVPESAYYTFIEPILNNALFNSAYADKNIYDIMYPEGLFPKTIIRCINGNYFDHAYKPLTLDDAALTNILKSYSKVIVKPSIDTGGGQMVDLYLKNGMKWIKEKDQTNHLNMKCLKSLATKDFLIQTVSDQCNFTKKFNPSSLNTLRILTYRSVKTEKVYVLQRILRVGAEGEAVDNSRAGGVAIGVNHKGLLNKYGTFKNGSKTNVINGRIDLNEEHYFPSIKSIEQKAIEIAEKNIHHRILGLDMFLDNKNKVRCIEVNNFGNEISFFQLNNGPLFNEHFTEIIDYCCANRSKMFDNYIL